MNPVSVSQGNSPIVLGLPHTGTFVPDGIMCKLNENGRKLADTDWHIDQLYDGVLDSATTVRANFHRYVIDANRDPSGVSLYPGQNTTTLVPLTDFDGSEIWNAPPTPVEIDARRTAFHAPYHAALKAELDRVREVHGVAILYDCHSIRSSIPFLFEGTLPDFNIGTNDGTTCASTIEHLVERACSAVADPRDPTYSQITNGRFKGGWTTRQYGRPDQSIHAIQMELAQSTYLATETPPWDYDEEKATALRYRLSHVLMALEGVAPSLREKT
ncbi:N-formylglutamate deformylase [uncultured Tateyamaria sp.]|uniref:N-formylglutamate deformylase n=1 Tax=uncultured Tateyamaria sp. TaxID=455651 RepID=UPI0026305A71|nr:N-formylglutamate deformylase [uncultured Tateyamaria sp.]